MKNKLMGFWVKLVQPVRNERGAQSLEWLGIAALLIMILAIISTAVSGQEQSITEIITRIITKISTMVGT